MLLNKNIMRKTIFSTILLACITCTAVHTKAQSQFVSAESKIALSLVVVQGNEICHNADKMLKNKLSPVLTEKGLMSSDELSRFCIVAQLSPDTKDVLPGPPVQIVQTYSVTLSVVDNMTQKVFASTATVAKGVGKTEEKSLIDAVKHINVATKDLEQCIEKGKAKIIEYYEAECDKIIRNAESMARQRAYDEAFNMLATIPYECPSAYSKALAAGDGIFEAYRDYACQVNLAKAKTVWAAEQNSTGAAAAGEYLSTIYPDAACYADAMTLYSEIKGKVLDDWNFEMKQYQDGVELKKAHIEAWRAIGVAYGSHQQPVHYSPNWLIR